MRGAPIPERVVRTMAGAKVTKLITVPTVLKNILEHVRQSGTKPDFPALDFVASASEKIPPEIFSRFHEQFGVELFDSIGSSEITYEWIANRQKEFKRGSLGKPIFGYEVRLVSPDHSDVTEPNVPGEAWIKSKTACFFYWRKYDKSRETFIGEWTRTGDNLYFDEDGFFWFSGRNDDMFKAKGLWVAPIEIEAALTGHPAVREAAVVSFTDRDRFTKPIAYVGLRSPPPSIHSPPNLAHADADVPRAGGRVRRDSRRGARDVCRVPDRRRVVSPRCRDVANAACRRVRYHGRTLSAEGSSGLQYGDAGLKIRCEQCGPARAEIACTTKRAPSFWKRYE